MTMMANESIQMNVDQVPMSTVRCTKHITQTKGTLITCTAATLNCGQNQTSTTANDQMMQHKRTIQHRPAALKPCHKYLCKCKSGTQEKKNTQAALKWCWNLERILFEALILELFPYCPQRD